MTNKRDPKLQQLAEQLAARDYDVVTSKDELPNGDTIYLVEHPEIEGCMAQGDTLDEALAELKTVTEDFIYFMLEDGLEIPLPRVMEPPAGSSGSTMEVTFTPKSDTLSSSSGSTKVVSFDEALDKAIQPEFRKHSVEISGNLIKHG